jgi:hypothetical protein
MALSVTYGSVATGHGQLPLQQFFHSSPNKLPNEKSPTGQDIPGKGRHSPPPSGPSSQENQQAEYLGVKFHHLPPPSELSSQEPPQVACSGVTLPCSAAEATASLAESSIGPSLPTQLSLPGDQPRKGSGPARTCADSSSARTQWAGSCSLDGRHIEKGEAAGRCFPAEGCSTDQALHMDDNLAEYAHVADAKDAAAESIHASSMTPQGVSGIDGNAHVDGPAFVEVLDAVTVTAVSQDSQLQGGAVTGGHCPRNVLLARTCVPKAASSEGLLFCENSVKAGQSSSKGLLSGGVYGTGGASFDDALLRMDGIKSSERLSLDSECVTRCTLPEDLPLNGEFMMRRTCPDPLLDDSGARSVEERPCPDTLPLDALGATSLEERRCCLQNAVQKAAAEARASRGSMHCDLRIALALQKQELNRDAATAAGAASSPLRPKAAFVWLSGVFTSCSASSLTAIILGIVPSYCDITWGLRQEIITSM